jgi:hypothetical protein
MLLSVLLFGCGRSERRSSIPGRGLDLSSQKHTDSTIHSASYKTVIGCPFPAFKAADA